MDLPNLNMKNSRLYLPLTVFTNTLYQGIGRIFSTVFGLAATVILTRYLGVVDFGQLNIIFVYVGLASGFADFGLGAILTRGLVKGKKEIFIRNIFALRIIISFFVFSLFIFFSFFFPYSREIVLGIILYSLGNLFLLIYNLISSMFQAKLIMKKHMVSQIGGSIVMLISTIVFVYLQLPMLFMVVAYTLGNIVTFGIGFMLIGGNIVPKIDKVIFSSIFKKSIPFFLLSVFAVLYWRADLLILSFFKNPEKFTDVGIYATAYRIFEVLVIFGTFFGNALLPILTKNLRSKNFSKIINEALGISIISGIITIILIFFLSKYIIFLIGGKNFMDAVLPLQILGVAFAFSLILTLFYNLIIAYGKQMQMIPVVLIALIFNIVTNIIFIPKFSYIASSIITVLTTFIIVMGYGLIIFRLKKNI